MDKNPVRALGFVLALVCSSCTVTRQAAPVLVPPQIDLRPRELIGVVQFGSTANGELGPLATRRFTEAARRDQGLVRIVDLGTRDQVLKSIARDRLDAEALIALGHKYGVKTIMTGDLAVSKVRPDVNVNAFLRSGSVTAQVDATLEVLMYETDSGAALWNRSGSTTHSVGQVQVWGAKQFAFDARDPEAAYGGLVDELVAQVSRPFQVSWVRP